MVLVSSSSHSSTLSYQISFQVLATFLVTVTASPLSSLAEIEHLVRRQAETQLDDGTADLAVEDAEPLDQVAEEDKFKTSQARVSSGAIAAILAAANARPTAIDRSPGYGKRSAQSEEESPEEVEDQIAEEANFQLSQARVPSGAIAAILAAANAKPKAIDRSPGYGKRSAETKEESEAKLGLVATVPLDAVKLKIHSSHGNIAQQYDGDIQYQNAVLGGRFGRGKREDNFIPFSVYDDRRVNTLKLEQNDFLALPERLQTKEKRKRNFSQS